jgi:transposase
MAAPRKRKQRLWDAYGFPGFRPGPTVRGILGDPKARIIGVNRCSKKHCAVAVDLCIAAGTIARCVAFAIFPCGDVRVFLEFEVRRVLCKLCGKVKRERLELLADSPFYTKRFAYFVGRQCPPGDNQGCGQGAPPRLAHG